MDQRAVKKKIAIYFEFSKRLSEEKFGRGFARNQEIVIGRKALLHR